MFYLSQFNGDISKWNTGNVVNMSDMFSFSHFNSDISQWNTSKVTSLKQAFWGSKFNGDLSKWNVSNVTNMSFIFCASSFTGDIAAWNLQQLAPVAFDKLASPEQHGTPIWLESHPEFTDPSVTPPYFSEFHDSPLGYLSLLSEHHRTSFPLEHPGHGTFMHEYTILEALGVLSEMTPVQARDQAIRIYQQVHGLDRAAVELNEQFEF